MCVTVYFVVEGDTEEGFVAQVLRPYLLARNIVACPSKVTTQGRRGQHRHQGGGITYSKWKDDLHSWIKQQKHRTEVWFTTMIDLYAMPPDFPGYDQAMEVVDPYQKVAILEEHLSNDIHFRRFIPYIQLHEFEALLRVDVGVLADFLPENADAVLALAEEIRNTRRSPEEIDNGPTTAPSKRIIRMLPVYEALKVTMGPLAAATIGLDRLRDDCPHFSRWVEQLEALVNQRKPKG